MRPRTWILWLSLYVVCLAALIGGLYRARSWALANQSDAAAQQAWQQWRDEAERQAAGAGPVQRRVPKSDEPPVLILMRDRFSLCISAAIVFGSALFFSFMFLVQGALQPPAT